MTNNIGYTDGEPTRNAQKTCQWLTLPGGGEAPGGNSVTIEVSVEANNNGAGNVYVIDGVQRTHLILFTEPLTRSIIPTVIRFASQPLRMERTVGELNIPIKSILLPTAQP